MNLECKAWYLTHRGKVRQGNEDSLLLCDKVISQENNGVVCYWESRSNIPFCIAVADGMGGHKAGERASEFCCEFLKTVVVDSEEQLQEILRKLNKAVFLESSKDSEFWGMGTTVAGLALASEGLFAFNVGDSRVYRVQDYQFLNQITKDHSPSQALENVGGFLNTNSDSLSSNTLTQAIGGSMELKEISPSTYPCQFREKAAYLLCTDGLTDMMGLEDMEKALLAETPELMVNALFDGAMKAGGRDNISIIYVEMEKGVKEK